MHGHLGHGGGIPALIIQNIQRLKFPYAVLQITNFNLQSHCCCTDKSKHLEQNEETKLLD